MGLYYFHITDNDFLKDEEGEEHPCPESAKAQAILIARELAGSSLVGSEVCVTDERGNQLALVRICPQPARPVRRSAAS
jgi:hypothetical protein